MQDTYNGLSASELEVINNTEFFRLKKEVTHKIEGSLAVLGENIEQILQRHAKLLPGDVQNSAPKISRGESYLGFPWLILDYPRLFSPKDTFAFRSMFWWGNYFSFTIHISGTHYENLKRDLMDNIVGLRNRQYYICINKDPWQHHFGQTNYQLLDELNDQKVKSLLEDANFIKLGRKIPLYSFSQMIEYGTETYKDFVEIL